MSDEFTDGEKAGFYKAIYSRRDVRSHFTQEPIDEETLTKILRAAHHAPSVGFSQPWNFILIKDMKTKQKVKESFQKEHERASKLVEDPKRSEYLSMKLEGIMESDVNICVTYDPTKFGPFIIGTTSIPEAGIYSVCGAIQNLWLAARAENIGLGWVSIVSNDMLREELNLPEHIVPVAYLCLGHVTNFETKPDLERSGWLPRLELNDVIYFEKWEQKENESWNIIQKMIKSSTK
ncbi:MAG: 5,6-dimethylbenzimidazole synthase [Crenarchaeota archaeon]|nr:5,6-dimethylbenzimidazole synthase [Thermoproteota archaeon]MDA1125218.1 5,6-dimethylbenzimidazole synthase [Thermoproteota archaeon]